MLKIIWTLWKTWLQLKEEGGELQPTTEKLNKQHNYMFCNFISF